MGKKAEKETAVFMDFVNKVRLPISDVTNQNPPHPDIKFKYVDEWRACELVEICDQGLYELVNSSKTGNGDFIRSHTGIDKALGKLKKTYECNYSIWLLCYLGLSILPEDCFLEDLENQFKCNNVFERVWFLGKEKVYSIY